jgi:hypothetical protein
MDMLLEFIKTVLEHQSPADKLKELAGLIDDIFQLMSWASTWLGEI